MNRLLTAIYSLLIPLSASAQVGIGTTSPDGILHLDKSAADTDLVIEKDDATNSGIIFHNAGAIAGQVLVNNAEVMKIRNYTSDADIIFNINNGGADTEMFRFDGSTSRLGIGTSTPDELLHTYTSTQGAIRLRGETTSGTIGSYLLLYTAQDDRSRGLRMQCADDSEWYAGVPYLGNGLTIGRHASQPEYVANSMLFINESGDVGINNTSPGYRLHVSEDRASSYAGFFYNDGNNNNRAGIQIQCGADDASTTGTQVYIRCYDGDGTDVGGINSVTGTMGTFDTSDERLKENIRNTTMEGRQIVNQLRVVDYHWKSKPYGQKELGFIAQEVQKIYPQMVSTRESNVLDSLHVITPSKLYPVITKALQEQDEIIEQLQKDATTQEELIRLLKSRILELQTEKFADQ